MTAKPKLCQDCKWWNGGASHLAQCAAPENIARMPVDLVDGRVRESWRSLCNLQREDGWYDSMFMGTCGTRARWWKPRA